MEDTIIEVLFGAAAVVAAIASFARTKAAVFRGKVEPIAVALFLAATAFFLQVTDILGKA